MHDFPFVNSPFAAHLGALFIPLILVAVLWTLILKGLALWYSARGHQKAWFVILLIVNTLGILELIYLIWFRPRKPSTDSSAPVHTSSSAQ